MVSAVEIGKILSMHLKITNIRNICGVEIFEEIASADVCCWTVEELNRLRGYEIAWAKLRDKKFKTGDELRGTG